MATRERAIDVANRRATRLRADLGRELREARIGGGLSQSVIGDAARVSAAQVSRIERGRLSRVALEDLVRIAAALGLDLSVRAYPGGDPIRDSAQLALLERLRSRLHPSLTLRTEAPLPIRGDGRAWDAVIMGRGFALGIEAETRLWDVQAATRRLSLKRRDGGLDKVVLLVSDTRHNRQVLTASRESLRPELPGDTRAILRRLAAGKYPDTSGIVVL